MRNLNKRILRGLKAQWSKNLFLFILLFFMISTTSGMLVSSGSIKTLYYELMSTGVVEDGKILFAFDPTDEILRSIEKTNVKVEKAPYVDAKINKIKDDKDISKEEMIALIDNVSLEKTEKEMMENIIEFDETLAREIMIPRPSIFAISKDTLIKDLFNIDNITRYSRIPIYENTLDNVVGILHTKDLIKIQIDCTEKVDTIMKEAYFVPDTKKISSLFIEMKNGNRHLAILIDEYGGVSGIVTLEDLLEEVVGEITDEYDKEIHDISEIGKNKYLVNAQLSINDLNDFFKTNFDSEYYDTVGGLLIEKLGYIPTDNQKISDIIIDDTCFKIQKVKNKQIQKVIITRNEVTNV